MVTQTEIARRCNLDVSSVSKILNRLKGPVFRKETVRKVFAVAKALGYEFGRLKVSHRRRHPRKIVSMPCELILYLEDGTVYDKGVARIRNISLSGAEVADVKLPRKTIPAKPFSVGLRPADRRLSGIEIPGRMLRITSTVTACYAIDFSDLEPHVRRSLRSITR